MQVAPLILVEGKSKTILHLGQGKPRSLRKIRCLISDECIFLCSICLPTGILILLCFSEEIWAAFLKHQQFIQHLNWPVGLAGLVRLCVGSTEDYFVPLAFG